MASSEIEWKSVTLHKEYHDLRLSMTIQEFLSYMSKNEKDTQVLTTPPMECTQRCGAKWILQVYPNGNSPGNYTDVHLKLVDKPHFGEVVSATYDMYTVGSDNSKLCYMREFGYRTNVEKELSRGVCGMALYNQTMINSKEHSMPNGNLTIRCEGKVVLSIPHQTKAVENISRTISANHYSELLKTMYEESICCDVVLKSGSSEFKCHKAILAAMSAYFKTKFGHDMKENRDNVVDVSKDLNGDNVVDLSKDLNGEELKALLDYIYVGKGEILNLSEASYRTLYRVSDMFEIDGLADVCERELIKQLNSENATDLLAFSLEFWAKRLKKATAAMVATCDLNAANVRRPSRIPIGKWQLVPLAIAAIMAYIFL